MKKKEKVREVDPREGYFVRDPEKNIVICPAGQILRQKCAKSNGYIRYMNKAACSSCEDIQRCYVGKKGHKEIDFADGARVVRCRNWQASLEAGSGSEEEEK